MELKEVQRHWNAFGMIDPLWAIVTEPDKRYGKWKPGEFFACGEEEIERILRHVDSLAFPLRRSRALDFGCGVGRLTQALGRRFQQCDGIDIAPSMIALAQKYDRSWRRFCYELARPWRTWPSDRRPWADCLPGFARLLKGQRCRYTLNDSGDLALFNDDTFDFIYSSLVLQHMRPEYSQNYIKEFLRVLAPGGLAVFQIPGQPMPPQQELPYQACLRAERTSLMVEPGARIILPVHVKNVSALTWPAVNLGNHWLSESGERLVNDDARATLPVGMKPGQEVDVSITVTAPKRSGHYWLEFDVVQESVVWFHTMGSETTRIPCQVGADGWKLLARCRRLKERIRASRAYRLGGRIRRRLRRSVHTVVAGGFEPVMEIYGVPKDKLVKWIESHGGKIIDIQQDFSVGRDWESFRYFVSKPWT